jgi:hypothetical protein
MADDVLLVIAEDESGAVLGVGWRRVGRRGAGRHACRGLTGAPLCPALPLPPPRERRHHLCAASRATLLPLPGEMVAGALNLIGSHAIYGRNWGCVAGKEWKGLHFECCYYQARGPWGALGVWKGVV